MSIYEYPHCPNCCPGNKPNNPRKPITPRYRPAHPILPKRPIKPRYTRTNVYDMNAKRRHTNVYAKNYRKTRK